MLSLPKTDGTLHFLTDRKALPRRPAGGNPNQPNPPPPPRMLSLPQPRHPTAPSVTLPTARLTRHPNGTFPYLTDRKALPRRPVGGNPGPDGPRRASPPDETDEGARQRGRQERWEGFQEQPGRRELCAHRAAAGGAGSDA